MSGQSEEQKTILAAVLLFLAAMLNPSVTVAVALLLLALALLFTRRRRA
jgi:uncharacterized protein (TIGR03382 family)